LELVLVLVLALAADGAEEVGTSSCPAPGDKERGRKSRVELYCVDAHRACVCDERLMSMREGENKGLKENERTWRLTTPLLSLTVVDRRCQLFG
jgi:hypothetical protein